MATTRTAAVTAGSKAADSASDELQRIDRDLRAFVNERPVLALLSALAAGYVVGRVMRRLA